MRIRIRWLLLLSLLSLLLLFVNLPPATIASAKVVATDSVIFDDAIVNPWEGTGWSYGTTVDLASAVYHTGSKGIAVTHTADGGAFKVHSTSPLSGADYGSISFWVYGAAGGSPINFFLGDTFAAGDNYAFTAPAGVWTRYDIALRELGAPADFDRINWQGAGGAGQATYYLDDIVVKRVAGFPDGTADDSLSLEPGPSGVALAPNGRVYAVVYQADRVYSWASISSMLNDDLPDKTFGEDNGDPDSGMDCKKGPSASIMCGPESIAVDSHGNLFVADTYFHRVLVFLDPDSDASPTIADAVLGQENLTSADTDHDSNKVDGIMEGFCFVRGLAVDSSDRLWVVDEYNFRVVRFGNPLVSSSLPSKVFGQADLDDHPEICSGKPLGGSGAAQFNVPLGIAVDLGDTLYVADYGNNRVQRFAALVASGAEAEASYTIGLDHAHDVATDAYGNVYIASTFGGKVLVFEGGPMGDLVPDHTFPGRNYPMGMAVTATGDLLVADCGAPELEGGYPPCVKGARGIYFFGTEAAPAPQPPVASIDSFSTLKNSPVSGNVLTNDTDPQSSPLSVTANTTPAHGALTVSATGLFTYTPNSGFLGQDLFQYTVSNGYNLTDTAAVTIVVTAVKPPNQPPVAVNDRVQTIKNRTVSGNVLSNDRDPAQRPLTVISHTQMDFGTLALTANGVFTFTPESDFAGQTIALYTISNSSGLTATATLTIKVFDEPQPASQLFVPALAH